MTLPQLPLWATDGSLVVEPPSAKKGVGFRPGFPEAAQYANWLMVANWQALRGLQHQYSDITVGTLADKIALKATHEIEDDWAGDAVAGSRITFISNVTLAGNEDVTADGVEILTAPGVVLSFSTFSLALSGDYARGRIRVSGAGTGDIDLSGAGTFLLVDGATQSAFALSGGAVGVAVGDLLQYDSSEGLWLFSEPLAVPPLLAVNISPGTASVDVQGLDGSFERYRFALSLCVPTTDGDDLFVQLERAGSFQSGASDYQHQRITWGQGVALSQAGTGSAGQINASGPVGNGTGESFSAVVEIGQVDNAAVYKHVEFRGVRLSTGGVPVAVLGFGMLQDAVGAVTGIRFMCGDGTGSHTFASGRLAVYGEGAR